MPRFFTQERFVQGAPSATGETCRSPNESRSDITSILRRVALSGLLKPDRPYSIADLDGILKSNAERLDCVSLASNSLNSSLRDATMLLAGQTFVRTARGVQLITLGSSEIAQVFEIRRVVEPTVVRKLAAGSYTSRCQVRRRLEVLLEKQTTHFKSKNALRWLEECGRFHVELAQMSSDSLYSAIVEYCMDLVLVTCVASFEREQDSDWGEGFWRIADKDLKDHRELVRLISQGEVSGAEKHMELHLEAMAKMIDQEQQP